VVHLHPLDRLRLQRGAEHLHRLGARPTAEFLAEVGHRIGGMPAIFALLGEYEERLSPRLLRLTGGHKFPPPPLHAVPSADARREAVR
jgi:hypothetical protein